MCINLYTTICPLHMVAEFYACFVKVNDESAYTRELDLS